MSDRPTNETIDLSLPVSVSASPLVGRAVGEYEVLAELGRGGMGVVYRARHTRLDRVVALKMLRDHHLAGPAELTRFLREAEAVAQLDHPQIVPIHEVGEHEGLPFFSMKLIEGGDLARLMAQPDGPPLRRLVEVLRAVALAVHHAHQRGIIHRDLKPENILLDTDGCPHVSDFGLARRVDGSNLTQSGAILGTPAYMAPEQAGRSGSVTTLSDVWALGAILYECLTGRPPFRAATAMETILQVLEQEPVAPRKIAPLVDRDLEAACMKCLAKDPQGRYASAAVLAEDLGRWLAGEPLSVRPPSTAYLAWLWLRKNVRAALWVLVIGSAGCGGAAILCLGPALMRGLAEAARAYDNFPSVSPPWLLRVARAIPQTVLDPPAAVMVANEVLFRVLFCSMGILLVLLVRPKGYWEGLALGLGAGLIGTVVAYALAVGPWVSVHLAYHRQGKDVSLLSLGSVAPNVDFEYAEDPPGTGRSAQQRLVERYPDLVDRKRFEAAHAITVMFLADAQAASFMSIWTGMIVAAVLCIAPVVMQVPIAMTLVRREGRAGPALLSYYELSAALAWLMLDFFSGGVVWPMLGLPFELTWWGVLALASLAGLAAVGVVNRWGWPLRWCLYAGWWLTLGLTEAHQWSHGFTGLRLPVPGKLPAALGLVLAVGVALLLSWRHYRSREIGRW
jgi:predicted Ser/Thr protein kinase